MKPWTCIKQNDKYWSKEDDRTIGKLMQYFEFDEMGAEYIFESFETGSILGNYESFIKAAAHRVIDAEQI